MYCYLQTVCMELDKRFPELEFMTTHFSFIEPPQRKLHQCDVGLVIDKFASEGVQFSKTLVHKQYRNYCHDSTLDFLFDVPCGGNSVKFFVKLFSEEEYSELARLALLIYTISPDTVTCERGFSAMNYIKNQYRSRLTQEKLNACMALAMDKRAVDNFPYYRI